MGWVGLRYRLWTWWDDGVEGGDEGRYGVDGQSSEILDIIQSYEDPVDHLSRFDDYPGQICLSLGEQIPQYGLR